MFDHEKLRVYQEALSFASLVESFAEQPGRSKSLHDQLERARNSILLNIAEGNGRFTAADRCRFFDMARGSSLECAACLDLLVIKKQITTEEHETSKQIPVKIVSMRTGLIRSNSPDRLHEEPLAYCVTKAD